MWRTQILLTFLILYILSLTACISPKSNNEDKSKFRVIVLTRHAEKVDESEDPPLSDLGMLRVEKLKLLLSDFDFNAVYSTRYTRVMQTVAPIAAESNIETQVYSVDTLWQLSDYLLNQTVDNVLVGGHSNSSPQLANYLSNSSTFSEIEHADYKKVFLLYFNGPNYLGSSTLNLSVE